MRDKIIQNKIQLKQETSDKFYLAYSEIFPNNPLLKAKLFEYFDFDIQRVFNSDKKDLDNFVNSYPDISIPRNFLSKLKSVNFDEIYNFYKTNNINYVTFTDCNYPEPLKNLEDFPVILFYKGDIKQNFNKSIGIVGSRKATEAAKLNVRQIISGFKNTDIVINSGLAAGIDSCSHKAALEFGIKTCAVIGSGLKFKYPSVNASLYEEIVRQNGVIISEYPYNYSPMPQNFPQRNRIITGLSQGIIIAEAKLKSGAMISARFAIEQNKELMCIPGAITNPNCEGIYHLLKTNAASIVTETNDICNILNWTINFAKSDLAPMSEIEKNIYDLVTKEEISIEGLKQNLDVGINELVMNLTAMELNGLIIQKNGLYYISGI